jgi:hypothetical protein
MLVKGYLYGELFFNQTVFLPPQADRGVVGSSYSIIKILSMVVSVTVMLALTASFVVNLLAGTIYRRSQREKPQFKELWQAFEIW